MHVGTAVRRKTSRHLTPLGEGIDKLPLSLGGQADGCPALVPEL